MDISAEKNASDELGVPPLAVTSENGNTKETVDENDGQRESIDMRASKRKSQFRRNSFFSAWVVDHERQLEGYTAGRAKSYCAIASAWIAQFALTALFILCLCRIETSDEKDTPIGFGDVVISNLVRVGAEVQDFSIAELSLGFALGGATFVTWILLYIFDVGSWKDIGVVADFIAKFLIFCAVGMTFVSALLLTNRFIALPFMAFLFFSLFVLTAIKLVFFRNVQQLFYLRALTWSTLVSGFIVMTIFVVFVSLGPNFYDLKLEVKFHGLLGCPENGTTFDEILSNEAKFNELADGTITLLDCEEPFLVWIAPAIFFTGTTVFSGVLGFLYRAEKKRITQKKAVGIEPLAQVFMVFTLVSILGLWVAASIASAVSALSDAILSLSFVSLVAVVFTAIALFGAKYLSSQLKKTSIGKMGFGFFTSDWGKGLLLVTSTPPLLLYLGVDYIKQLVRRKTCLGRKIVDPEEKKMKFTKPISQALAVAAKWEFGSVITKALVWGMVFFTLNVGVTRITLVFLSFLRDTLSQLDLLQTTLILMAVGIVMFLLPPIPGVPVYITAGVILPDVAARSGIGLVGAIFYGVAISMVLKISALVMQQKLIGECCGSRSVRVRYAVGINSVPLRAMRRVLKQPGFSYKKVAILCGGPDWPTSVLTGIMKLNVFAMILGTLPVVVLIAPCVVSGAMLVLASAEPNNSTVASINTVAIFLTIVVQLISMLAAAQVLSSAAVTYEKELRTEKPDEEVLALEKASEEKSNRYRTVTAFVNLGTFWKVMHIFNLMLMIVSCYAFQLFGSTLFKTFDITDSITEDLQGNVFNLVRNIGWVFVGLFLVSTTYYFIFTNIHKRKMVTEEMIIFKKPKAEDDDDEEKPKEIEVEMKDAKGSPFAAQISL